MNETAFIAWSDIKKIFLSHFRVIRNVSLACGLIVLGFFLLRPPQYLAEASFHQAAKEGEEGTGFEKILKQFTSSSMGNSALLVMQSQMLLKKTLEELGLQAEIKTRGMVAHFCDHVKTWFSGRPLEMDTFVFRKVMYPREMRSRFFLKILSPTSFELFDGKKKLLGKAELGQPFSYEEIAFTLLKFPSRAKVGTFYSLYFYPWQESVQKVEKRLHVREMKNARSLLALSYLDRDRHLAAAFLNLLMHNLRGYLKEENEEIAKSQVAYLENRQQELMAKLERDLHHHAAFIKEGVNAHGFLDLSQESASLCRLREKYLLRSLEIDLEENRLKQQTQPLTTLEKESIEKEPLLLEIRHVDEELKKATEFLNAIESSKQPPADFSPKSLMGILAQQFQRAPHEKKEWAGQVKSYLHHLEEKKGLLAEDLQFKEKESLHFSPLNLETSYQMLSTFTKESDHLSAQMREMIFLRDHSTDPMFELSAMGTFSADPILQELLKKAGEISLQLKDDSNRSLRDQERLQEMLKVQKAFLSQYFFQAIELTKLRAALVADKIEVLRHSTLDLLHQERRLLQQKLFELNQQMSGLPERWKKENLLSLHKEMGLRVLQGMSQLAETKSINQHLFHVNSKPLDAAIAPIKAQTKLPFIWGFSAFLLSGILCFSYYFVREQ